MQTGVEVTREQLIARIAELEKGAAKRAARGTSLRVSTKGAVSFYGVGRFPVTLYESQWPVLLAEAPQILAFIEKNKALLAHKPTKEE
jgi:hypothetical protein